ncbi:TonB-dependent receptor family protein [Aquabacterium humicola]|uniref:TonB-dependent receptor family protein n=1 Tax=Aquabacterium humicola TaxID=3237377 RepID=UPI002543DD8F|nr:TonB-dependent receptor [Rubrivivax pictus]
MTMRPLPAVVLAPLALAAALAAAQPAPPAQTVVVTGSARAQALVDAPYAISVIDADTLREAGPLINLSEAMARVPGLVVNNRNNYAQDLQISARGFGARAAFGVRGLRIYADGIPATMPDGQGQVAHLDLAGAERIEVLRGPFSALYGNSSGGVIALFTARVLRNEAEAAFDAGSFGLRQARVGVAAKLGGELDVRANAAVVDSEGFRPQSAAHRTLGNLRLGWQGASDSLVLLASDHRQRAQDPLGLSRVQFDADARSTAPQALQFDTRKAIEQSQLGLQWRHRFGSGDADGLRESTLTAYEGRRAVTQWLAIAPATQGSPRHGGGIVDFDRDYRGIEGRLAWRFGRAHAVIGLNAESQDDDRRGYENYLRDGKGQPLGFGLLRRAERNRADTREGFAQADWPFAAHWAISTGVRSGRVVLRADDRYLSNGNDSGRLEYRYTNPVLGLRWTVRPGWTVHAGAARGFESPTLGELAYRPDSAGGFNDRLKGQSSRQVELGSKWRARGFELDAVLFAIETTDEIGVLTNAGGRSSFQNTGRTRRHGAELAVGWQIDPTLHLQLAAQALHATYRDGFLTCAGIPCTAPTQPVPAGNRIAGAPAAGAYAELAWRPGVVPGAFALEWRAMGRTPVNDANSEFASGYALVNLRWSHRLELGAADALELLARIDNATDRRHAGSVIVNDANGRFYEPGAPRSGLLSVRWRHAF